MLPAPHQRRLQCQHKSGLRIAWVECAVIVLCLATLVRARCSAGGSCYRGECVNDTCVCQEGWQGTECQHCTGKIRLTDLSGFIHDGPGNYSVGVKCSWMLEPPAVDGRTPLIRIRLEHFATECGWDHLYIYDGDSVRAPPLGVFSGVVSDEESSTWTRQVVARSGRALLHFFSDDAYSMAGFNISYAVNACPSDSAGTNCSNHGTCEDGVCSCDPGWLGLACDRPLCPDECGADRGWGECRSGGCACAPGRGGDDCGQSASAAGTQWLWREPGEDSTQNDLPPPVAGHALLRWRGSLLRVGGESYGKGAFLYQYHLQEQRWQEIVGPSTGGTWPATEAPTPRFAHSAVVLRDSLIMYGGRVPDLDVFGNGVAGREGAGGDVTNELWILDLTSRIWTNATPDDCPRHVPAPMGHCGGLHVAGHSAVMVELERPARSVMLSFFGHSPHYGYLNIVQEYWVDQGHWTAPITHGWPARGGFAHSAAWDPLSRRVYVHGGLLSESESNQLPSAALYSYEPVTRVWRLLASADQPRYMHTATFITPGIMLVFGGNVHNDTNNGGAHRCRSGGATLYDVRCDTWHAAPAPSRVARAGHAAAPLHRPNHVPAVLIYGGFDGRLRSDAFIIRTGWEEGGCGAHLNPGACLNSARRAALKCVWREGLCLHITEIGWQEPSWNGTQVLSCSDSDTSARGIASRCMSSWSCSACVAAGCVWCGACHSGPCHRHRQVAFEVDQCATETEEAVSACGRLHSCAACHQHSITHHTGSSIARGCHWDFEHVKCRPGNATEEPTRSGTPLAVGGCPGACTTLHTCANCTAEECIWCASAARCVDKNAYSASFPLGGCRAWSTSTASSNSAICTRAGSCESLASCAHCRAEPACGWCDDGSGGGRGVCVPGGARGPHTPHTCPAERWHFTRCPACQCNGHSVCTAIDNALRCVQPCAGRAVGDHCDQCAPGHWGEPLNGGTCQPCECNAQALSCAADTGRCFCSTKGLAGEKCDKCDATNHYHADPLNKGACYYDLAVDYQFTFNLSKKEDRHLTAINFRNSPVKADVDADFNIACSAHARMNITVRTHSQPGERLLFHDVNCSNFRYRFARSEHTFGVEDNVTLTTFFVYVYDFRPPLWIQISFSQYPKLNLQQFFITFSSCFLLLLLVAAAMWKIKQKYDMYRRRQRLFVEMEAMASRPFSQVAVELERGAATTSGVPSPVALEPCRGSRAAVLSLLVRLPTGGTGVAPPLGGLAVASALVTLGHAAREPHAPPPQRKPEHRAPAAL